MDVSPWPLFTEENFIMVNQQSCEPFQHGRHQPEAPQEHGQNHKTIPGQKRQGEIYWPDSWMHLSLKRCSTAVILG